MRILVALGGNALLRGGEGFDPSAQEASVELAAGLLARIAAENELVVTHGSSPQADVLGAESQGVVGCMLELALRNALPERDLLTILTEVVVDGEDPASPEPRAIVELRSLRTLIEAGVLVICAGGGGIPVTVGADGTMHGVQAVVDRDLTASLLARRLDAGMLVMLTDVDGVHLEWGTEGDGLLRRATPAELREHDFESGSMGPKVEAACRFVEATGARAAIGSLRDAAAIVRGEAGTQIVPLHA
jgi:carbamate kinase